MNLKGENIMDEKIEEMLMEESIKVFNQEALNKKEVFQKLEKIVPILRKRYSLKTHILKQWVKDAKLKNACEVVDDFLEQRYEELRSKGFQVVKIKFGSDQDNEISCLPTRFSQEISIEYIGDKTSWEYLDLVFMSNKSRLLKNDISLKSFQEKVLHDLKEKDINFYNQLKNECNSEKLKTDVIGYLNRYEFWCFYNYLIESEINLRNIEYQQIKYEEENILSDFMEYYSIKK